MSKHLLEFEDIPPQLSNKIKQDLKFKTGNFVWRIQFNIPLDPKTVNNDTMFVTNSQDQKLSAHIKYDTQKEVIEIEPLEPYAVDEFYSLVITTDVCSKGGQRLQNPVSVRFKL